MFVAVYCNAVLSKCYALPYVLLHLLEQKVDSGLQVPPHQLSRYLTISLYQLHKGSVFYQMFLGINEATFQRESSVKLRFVTGESWGCLLAGYKFILSFDILKKLQDKKMSRSCLVVLMRENVKNTRLVTFYTIVPTRPPPVTCHICDLQP